MVALSVVLTGRAETMFLRLRAWAEDRREVTLDCRQLVRIDFACASELLNEVVSLQAGGKPVLNADLVKDLDAALAGRTVRFEWVRGHVGHPLNEAADSRARCAATAYQQGRPVPSGPGWPQGERTRGAAPDVASDAAPSKAPAAPQTDALF